MAGKACRVPRVSSPKRQRLSKRLSASVVCEGFWRRVSPMTCTNITSYYHASSRDWYGLPRHRTMILLEDGTTKQYVGTYRSTRCLKLVINNIDNTPTGTLTCNQCVRVPLLPSFVAMTQRPRCPHATNTNNKFLSREDLVIKLVRVNNTVRNLRKQVFRNMQRKLW